MHLYLGKTRLANVDETKHVCLQYQTTIITSLKTFWSLFWLCLLTNQIKTKAFITSCPAHRPEINVLTIRSRKPNIRGLIWSHVLVPLKNTDILLRFVISRFDYLTKCVDTWQLFDKRKTEKNHTRHRNGTLLAYVAVCLVIISKWHPS